MVKQTYEIAEEAKELRERVHADLDTNEEVTGGKIAWWTSKVLELQEATAQKLDELFERLVRLEDEIRKGRGAQRIGSRKSKKGR